MDTHLSQHPALEPEEAALSARLPGEEGNTQSDTEPVLEHPVPDAGERLAVSKRAPAKRQGLLLAGAACVLVVVVGVFLVSPLHHVQQMPRFASSGREPSSASGPRLPPVLAPSASLAKVTLPPRQPAIREPYAAVPRDREVAELLSLDAGTDQPAAPPRSTARPVAASEPVSVPGSPTTPAVRKRTKPADADFSPEYVANEPGAVQPFAPVLVPTASAVRSGTVTAAILASVSQPLSQRSREAPADLPEHSSQASEHTSEEAAAPVTSARRATAIPRSDAVAVAENLRAERMSSADQVAVLGLVTEMASIVRSLREQNAQLRADFASSSADTTARLGDFERRLMLAEARNAVTSASNADATPTQSASTPTASVVKAQPVSLTRVIAVLPPAMVPESATNYRVQAASPGLALLAQVDRGGGDGAQMQVVVGDNIPGYGRVKSIGQRGTTWIVATEHGAIE